jgi:hypothetical protein
MPYKDKHSEAAKASARRRREKYEQSERGKAKIQELDRNKHQRHKDTRNAKRKEWYEGNKEKQRDSAYKKLYQMTLDDYNRMFADQEGKCLICKIHQNELKTKLCVDHCHTTGLVRGLLCNSCNNLLARAKDSIETLQNAITYLSSAKVIITLSS